MVRLQILALSLLLTLPGLATPPLPSLSNQKTERGLILLAKNPALIAQTIEVQLTMSNLVCDRGSTFTYVIPPRVRNHKVATVTKLDPRAGWSFNVNYKSLFGDMNARPKENTTFQLPFPVGTRFRVDQGEGGTYSHKYNPHNFNAIDFNMEEGSAVLAMRDGIVFDVEESFHENCNSADCADKANYVRIVHEDGTYTSYVHLKQFGARVKVGQNVKAGDHIGDSGNTGWSDAPHLHVAHIKHGPDFGVLRSIPMHFATSRSPRERLVEGRYYKR